MVDIFLHNRLVAQKRWSSVLSRELAAIASKSAEFPELKARLVGYLMGDGSVTARRDLVGEHHVLAFFPDDIEMLDSFLDAFDKIYGFIPRIELPRNHYRLRVHSKPIVVELLLLGSFRSLEWRAPVFLLKSTESKREWLRAMFDCEGHVGKKVIALQSVNQKGILDVQKLLTGFGIESRVYTYKRKQEKWNQNFLLYITKNAARRTFLKEIGFHHGGKQEKLLKFAAIA